MLTKNRLRTLFPGVIARTLAGGALLFLIAKVLLGAEFLTDLMDAFSLVLSAAVIRKWGPDAWDSAKSERPEEEDLLMVGIVLSWIGIHLGVWLSIALQTFGLNIYQGGLVGARYALAIAAAFMHLLTPEKLSRKRSIISDWKSVALGCVAGLVLTGILFATRAHLI